MAISTTLFFITDLFLDNIISQKLLEEQLRDSVRAALIGQHCFQHQKSRRKMSTPDGDTAKVMFKSLSMKRTFSEIGRTFSMKSKGGKY